MLAGKQRNTSKKGLMKGIKTFSKNKKNIVAKDIVTFLKKKRKRKQIYGPYRYKDFLEDEC